MRSLATAVLAVSVLAAATVPASAHRLKVFATVVGATVEGRAYFVGGGPAAGVAASLRGAGDRVVAEGRTGADGRFALPAPDREDITVVVDAKDGHVARFPIPAARLPGTLSPGPMAAAAAQPAPERALPAPAATTVPPADIEAALARQIEPLAEQIDALEASVRFRDVLGGIGYIVGVFGLFAFVRRRARP